MHFLKKGRHEKSQNKKGEDTKKVKTSLSETFTFLPIVPSRWRDHTVIDCNLSRDGNPAWMESASHRRKQRRECRICDGL